MCPLVIWFIFLVFAGLLKSKSFNSGDTQVKDHQHQKSHERRSIGSKDNGKGGHSKTFCKSQSFKGALSKFSVPDISKTKKIASPTSPRVDDQMRVRQAEHHSSSAMKSVPKFGSSNADDKRNAESGELTLKHFAAANHCDQKMIQGHEHLSDSLESRRCLPQKGPGDQHEENNRNVNKVKAESSCKAYELDANRSSRGSYLDYSVLCPGGVIPQVDIVWKYVFSLCHETINFLFSVFIFYCGDSLTHVSEFHAEVVLRFRDVKALLIRFPAFKHTNQIMLVIKLMLL